MIKKSKKTLARAEQPKPQIPTMLQALRREREKARSFIDALEAKLTPVLRPQTDVPVSVSEGFGDAAPMAQLLCESVGIIAALNARLRSITGRVEL